MNKKFFSVLLAVVLTAGYAQAQITFGVRAGLNLTNFYGSDVDGGNMKPGFQIGIVGAYELSDNLAIQPGLLFATQGSQEKEGDWKSVINLNYLQIPINVQYKLDLGDMNLLLQAGPYFGFGISGKSKEKYDGETESTKIKFGSGDDKMNILDLGLGIGAGLQFGNIQAGLGYNFGFANLVKDVSWKNNGLALTVTYFFGK